MKLFSISPDGGPESPVRGLFIVEIKSLFSIVILRFATGGREAFHTHAFHALTWFISGSLHEQVLQPDGSIVTRQYRRSFIPKITRRQHNHRVIADRTSWCISIRGPWSRTWTEDTDTHHTILTHGRKIIDRHQR